MTDEGRLFSEEAVSSHMASRYKGFKYICIAYRWKPTRGCSCLHPLIPCNSNGATKISMRHPHLQQVLFNHLFFPRYQLVDVPIDRKVPASQPLSLLSRQPHDCVGRQFWRVNQTRADEVWQTRCQVCFNRTRMHRVRADSSLRLSLLDRDAALDGDSLGHASKGELSTLVCRSTGCREVCVYC